MPKKMGVNSKAEEALARKATALADKKERDDRDKEDAYWRELEGPKSKAAQKRKEETEKRAEAVAKKAEVKKLAEQEEKELDKYGRRVDNKRSVRVAVPVPKVTAAELARQKEQERLQLQAQQEDAKKRASRMADAGEYESIVSVQNTNRDESLVDAHSIDTALVQITVANDLPPDRHPERRLKASFKAFEEAELPRLKEEKPGLTHRQYKDMIFKLWKKSPDNPMNQAVQCK